MRNMEPAEPYVPYEKLKKSLPKDFPKLASEYRDLADSLKVLEARKREVGDLLCAALMKVEHTRVEVGNLWVRQQNNVNTRIDPKLLLKEGVPGDVIVKATVTKITPFALVQVKPEPGPLVEEGS